MQRIFGGIPQDGADLGPDDAEITITVFNDLQCAPCAEFEIETIDPLVERYARTDEARIEFRHFSLGPQRHDPARDRRRGGGRAGAPVAVPRHLRPQPRRRPRAAAIDEEFLREVAEAVPELDPEQWEEDYADPARAEKVRTDAMLAAELKLPAEPAVIVTGPEGERTLIETPTAAEIEDAIAQVSGPA